MINELKQEENNWIDKKMDKEAKQQGVQNF